MPGEYSTIRVTVSWIVFEHPAKRFGGFCRFKVRLMNVAAGAKMQKNAGRISFF
jgi:hypothetical protein